MKPDLPPRFDLSQVKVFPLEERKSITRLEDILIDPEQEPLPVDSVLLEAIEGCADRILDAKNRRSAILLFYGAHLLRNGAAGILHEMMKRSWLTHLATNGAGSIHDWEYAWLGRSTENVRENVADGTFGTWDETGRFINLAIQTGVGSGLGYGAALGKMIAEDGLTIPDLDSLRRSIANDPEHPLAGSRCDLLSTLSRYPMAAGRLKIPHPYKKGSIFASAWMNGIPLTVHPGIGYDIITNHPMFSGAAVGRAAALDFNCICSSIMNLSHGVVLSVGSAIMAPQVFEKGLSCVNNVRLQKGLDPITGHVFHVVDLQDGGNWDWKTGEPPKTNPAYYLRFCKSFIRMGGEMFYHQCDNLRFIHQLYHALLRKTSGVHSR